MNPFPPDPVSDARLPDVITPEGLPCAEYGDPSAVLLTGATGYLGVFVLEQLLRLTRARIYCLVRATDPVGGMLRLRQAASRYGVDWDERCRERVKPVIGDLAQPSLGMSERAFASLAERIDAIYHNGAAVNLALPYAGLREANARGTLDVLRLACTAKVKAVHYVSTMEVLYSAGQPRPFLERDVPEEPLPDATGYALSKWVGERLLAQARDRGIPATVFRPTLIVGNSKTGACQDNYFVATLRALLERGVFPQIDQKLNIVSVDYAAEAMVRLSLRSGSIGEIFHLCHTEEVPLRLFGVAARSFGYDLETVSLDDTVARLLETDPEHPAFSLVPVVLQDFGGTHDGEFPVDNRLECANTLAGTEELDAPLVPVDETYVRDCLAFLIDRDMLRPPHRAVSERR